MFLKKYLFLIIISIANSSVFYAQEFFHQKFQLTWVENQKIVIDAQHTIYLPLIDGNFIDYERRLPQFFSKWNVPFNSHIDSFELKNIVFENVNPSDLLDINIQNIPNLVEVKLEAVSTREVSDAFLTLIPLLKDGNQMKRIVSFELNYSLKQTNNSSRFSKSTNTSVLSGGKWYKIAVDTTGIFKIDRSFLNNLGINVNEINPKNISIYGNGGTLLPYKIGDFRYDDLQENSIFIKGEEDSKFDNEDFILFYAKGPESWKHNNSSASLRHVKNIYSDKAYYFIHISNVAGKRIQEANLPTGTPTLLFQNFDDYWVYEKDQINLIKAGQQWFAKEDFGVYNSKTITHTFSNLDVSIPVSIKTRVGGISVNATQFIVTANGSNLYTLSVPNTSQYTQATTSESTTSMTLNNENISIVLNYNSNGNPSAKAYLDYIEIRGKKKLIVGNKQFSFRNFETLTHTGIVNYQLQNTSNIFKIWDVTDHINVTNVINQSTGNNFEFKAQGGVLKEYIVVNSQNFYTPTIPTDSAIENQNLHSLTQVDYLIITRNDFINEAETLAQYHRTHEALNVKVVPLHQIYNEFGSGSSDITAIRDFVRHVYLNSNMRLKYLLLYGDASFDFKKILGNQAIGIVPSFEFFESFNMSSSIVTDDYFAIVSDLNEGDLETYSTQTQDVAVSRIPFNSSQEAQQINAKLLNYYTANSRGDWHNEVLMVADDSDASHDEVLQTSQETLSDRIKLNKPLVNIKKLWTDAYPQQITAGGSRYPQANEIITNSVEKGILMINYFGHGGEDGLALERIMETAQIENWYNLNNLNLLSVISCEFARFDNPLRPNTAGELAIRNSHGGSVHEIASARAVYISVGLDFNKISMDNLMEYNGVSKSISEHLRVSKNTYPSSQRFFIFSFGDPAMPLALPKPNIKLTLMNGIPITQSPDTIKALSRISFDGIVTQSNDQIDPNFNGEVFLTVFDKPMDKHTLNNDGLSQIMTFDTQDSKLFRGRASVTNGNFHIEFVTPQDIRIAYGYGKLSFYAHNSILDKGGFNNNIVVGGINYNAVADNIGPKIKLYMNDISFIDGGNTNQSPLFLAMMEDENGINSSFSSVDHDITAVLDDDQQNPIILNDYYITNLNDYSKGSVEYRMRNLAVGHHQIKLKAYDTYNNMGEASLNFVVVDDAALVLEHVLNYPNPFVNFTEFWFNHNKPNEPLEVQVQIYTVSGKLVKTINQNILNTGSLSRDITWNGLDDFGQKIGKGVYVFKLSVHTTSSQLKAEKFEKLVILQ